MKRCEVRVSVMRGELPLNLRTITLPPPSAIGHPTRFTLLVLLRSHLPVPLHLASFSNAHYLTIHIVALRFYLHPISFLPRLGSFPSSLSSAPIVTVFSFVLISLSAFFI